MARIGIVGLGIMGVPMMVNAIKAGHSVKGYNKDPKGVEALEKAGGTGVSSIAEACTDVDIFITMVPDSPQVEEVVLGKGGMLENAQPGLLHIDMSSIRPDVSQRVAAACAEKGIRCLDAPVSGGERGAIEGSLSIMVGGKKEDFDEALPVLETMGKTIVYLGPAGSGQTVKAANQLIVGGTYQLIAEAIVFLEAYGVDTEAAIRVLGGGLAGSRIMEIKGETMLKRDFAPGFRIDLHHKDMGIVTAAAREAGVVIPVGALIAQLIASARAQGDGGLDHSALLRGVERMSGRFDGE